MRAGRLAGVCRRGGAPSAPGALRRDHWLVADRPLHCGRLPDRGADEGPARGVALAAAISLPQDLPGVHKTVQTGTGSTGLDIEVPVQRNHRYRFTKFVAASGAGWQLAVASTSARVEKCIAGSARHCKVDAQR